MSISKKHIITGAPGTGKTTLIKALKTIHPCMDEIAREVIVSEQEAGNNGTPWQDLQRFVQLVFEATSKQLPKSNAWFCDRALLDLEAYLILANLPIPTFLAEFPYQEHYHSTVFFAPTWQAIYCTDPQRLQTFKYCQALEIELKKRYQYHGFEIVEIPKVNPETRKDFVLDQIP